MAQARSLFAAKVSTAALFVVGVNSFIPARSDLLHRPLDLRVR